MPGINFKHLPDELIGNITLNTVANFAVGNIVTGGTSHATGKVIKIDATSKILRVSSLTGFFTEGETVTNTGTGVGTVAVHGFDLSATSRGIEHVQWTGARIRRYLITALRNFSTKWADAIGLPTFTATAAYSALVNMITGDTLTITVASSEGVVVSSGSYINVVIGANTRKAYYTSGSSTTTSLAFRYIIVAGDVASAGNVSTGTTIIGEVSDIVGQTLVANPVTFVAPNVSSYTVN